MWTNAYTGDLIGFTMADVTKRWGSALSVTLGALGLSACAGGSDAKTSAVGSAYLYFA